MLNTDDLYCICQRWKRYALDLIRVTALALALAIGVLITLNGAPLALLVIMIFCGVIMSVACGIFIGVNGIELENLK